jgi:hypothetical protein
MFKFAVFTDEDGNPIAVDANDAVAIGVEESEMVADRTVTRIYCASGDFWAVQNDFEEVKRSLEDHINAIED